MKVKINKCKVCEKELDDTQIKYCSNDCKAVDHSFKKGNSYHSQTIRGLRRKIKLLNLKGGKCENCNYNKNISALEFHHKCCKNFGLDMRSLSNRKWEDLIAEAENCKVLCANCHREQHNPELDLVNISSILDNSRIKQTAEIEFISYCEECNVNFKKITGKRYCSAECREKAKKYPSKEELFLKFEELSSWTRVSEFYNLCTKTIRRLRK